MFSVGVSGSINSCRETAVSAAIESAARVFDSSIQAGKASCAGSIVTEIRDLNPPGRFILGDS
jgi:hypothetical protein